METQHIGNVGRQRMSDLPTCLCCGGRRREASTELGAKKVEKKFGRK